MRFSKFVGGIVEYVSLVPLGWQIKCPICNFVNGSGETKEEQEKFNTKPKKALTAKLLMRL